MKMNRFRSFCGLGIFLAAFLGFALLSCESPSGPTGEDTLMLSGTVYGGEYEGNHITGAVVTAYADENLLSRIASVNVSSFAKMTAAPYYYSSSWSMPVPTSFSGKNVYFSVEETLGGPAGTRTHVWDKDLSAAVSDEGTPDIDLGTSYVWYKWIGNGNDNAANYTVGLDGTITVTTTETVESEWDAWRQCIGYRFPAENGVRYAYEFEAWTPSGQRTLSVQHITDLKYDRYYSEGFTIDSTRKTFAIVSSIRFDPNVRHQLQFHVGHPQITGTFYLKLKSIQAAAEYVPPPVDGSPRLTATATAGGIHLKADLRALPDKLMGVAFYDDATKANFNSGWIWYPSGEHPDFYEILYPYVEAGKAYTFSLEYLGDSTVMGRPVATVTATGGRGELGFSNVAELAVLKEGDTVSLNKPPVLSAFNDANAVDKKYVFQIASGTSWYDPLAEWGYSYNMNSLGPVDLIEVLQNLSEWTNTSGFLGKTSFAEIYYSFTYDHDDVYISGHPSGQRGSFRTGGVFSTPFVYPNVLPGIFTAVPDSEGVRFILDLTRILPSTSSLHIAVANGNSAQYGLWLGSYAWGEWGEFAGEDTIEVIYPFVQAGKTYTFQITYEGSGAVGQATVTAAAGLGEFYFVNAADIGLVYHSDTQTLSLTTAPILSSFDNSNPNIGDAWWDWLFNKGYDWSDSTWINSFRYDEPKMSFVLDNDFDSYLPGDISNAVVFVSISYRIRYRGADFYCDVAMSPPFRFPSF
jgi:hypothetical protein